MTDEELKLKYPKQRFGQINIEREMDYWIDESSWKIYLDHSCDEWVIGNIVETEKFYRDLGEALEYCRNNP